MIQLVLLVMGRLGEIVYVHQIRSDIKIFAILLVLIHRYLLIKSIVNAELVIPIVSFVQVLQLMIAFAQLENTSIKENVTTIVMHSLINLKISINALNVMYFARTVQVRYKQIVIVQLENS